MGETDEQMAARLQREYDSESAKYLGARAQAEAQQPSSPIPSYRPASTTRPPGDMGVHYPSINTATSSPIPATGPLESSAPSPHCLAFHY